MLKFIAAQNRKYFEKLSEAEEDLQVLTHTFKFFSDLTYFRYALKLRQYTGML
jgi:hypothetical protein